MLFGRPNLARWQPLRARGVEIDFPFFLAPMVGLSHVALRLTVRAYLPRAARTLAFTEMLSSRRLPAERIGGRPETAFEPCETLLVPQILGNEERFIAASLDKLRAMRPVAVDLNMGCPVPQALRHNWGVALMSDPRRAEEVVRATVRNAPGPVSVKMRTGLADDPEYLMDFGRMLEAAGASWITLHPRCAGQRRRGAARWDYVARLRDAVGIPVVGNGDVQTAADAFELMRRTGCDGVMIGRAAIARPWIFWQIGERLGLPPPCGRHHPAPADGYAEGREFQVGLERFIALAEERFAPAEALKRLAFFVEWGGRWLDFGHDLWRRVTAARTVASARAAVGLFFTCPQRMAERSALAS